MTATLDMADFVQGLMKKFVSEEEAAKLARRIVVIDA